MDGLLFCNEADLPYQLGVGPEAVAAMAAVIGAVRREISRPFGVNLVWDPVASLAVARATGASFVREVFTGVYESDLGIMRPDFGAIGAYRAGHRRAATSRCSPTSRLSSPARPGAARSPSGRPARRSSASDALLISGAITGEPTDLAQLRAAKAAVAAHPGARQYRRDGRTPWPTSWPWRTARSSAPALKEGGSDLESRRPGAGGRVHDGGPAGGRRARCSA